MSSSLCEMIDTREDRRERTEGRRVSVYFSKRAEKTGESHGKVISSSHTKRIRMGWDHAAVHNETALHSAFEFPKVHSARCSTTHCSCNEARLHKTQIRLLSFSSSFNLFY